MTASTAATIACGPVRSPADAAEHHRIRRAVFVEEQGIFAGTDVDEHDADERTHRVLGRVDDAPAGTVRLYPLDPEAATWQGDRLAVLPGFRAHGLGAPLVRYAVATAAALGGRVMLAHTQVANVRFFEYLGWRADGDIELYYGHPHVLMRIPLA